VEKVCTFSFSDKGQFYEAKTKLLCVASFCMNPFENLENNHHSIFAGYCNPIKDTTKQEIKHIY